MTQWLPRDLRPKKTLKESDTWILSLGQKWSVRIFMTTGLWLLLVTPPPLCPQIWVSSWSKMARENFYVRQVR